MTDIEAEIAKSGIGEGWHDIVRQLYADIEKVCPGHEVGQIKEKFGGLRYYPRLGSCGEENRNKVYHLLGQAEKQSYITCERCGEPGRCRQELRWIKTFCDKHFEEHLEQLAALRREMKETVEEYKNKE